MKIGFYLAEGKSTTGYLLADLMIRSVKRSMPGIEITQFSDQTSSRLYGADKLIRREGTNFMRLRLEHYALAGEWMFIDIDLLVQQNVQHVFDDKTFDIAIADRSGSILPQEVGLDFMKRMPHNLGVVFSRSPAFWIAALKKFDTYDKAFQNNLFCDQLAVCDTIKEQQFNVRVLPGARYNLAPMEERQDVRSSAIVHYKGNRKYWLLNTLYTELGIVA